MTQENRGDDSIMCSQRLWRMVGSWNLRGAPPAPAVAGSRLGPWAATVSKEDERSPVLAIDVGTCLTVVFPLGEPLGFHAAFAGALAWALQDLGVPSETIAIEQAGIRTLGLKRLADEKLRETLNTVDFMCGLELSYATDLHTVQRRLNEFPHSLPPYNVAEIAARNLFGVPCLDVPGTGH